MKSYNTNNPTGDFFHSTITKITFSLFLVFAFSFSANAKTTPILNSNPESNKCLISHSLAAAIRLSSITPDESSFRENRCLQTGRWIGAISGSSIGFMQIYWSATGMTGIHGPFWKNVVTGIPSAVIGAYVGTKSTEWTTKQIMKGNPKPVKAALKGMAYGAIDGAIIGTASMVPLIMIGHYAGTIRFNFSDDMIILKILGSAIAGGVVFGGLNGAAIGVVYGPGISLYMKF